MQTPNMRRVRLSASPIASCRASFFFSSAASFLSRSSLVCRSRRINSISEQTKRSASAMPGQNEPTSGVSTRGGVICMAMIKKTAAKTMKKPANTLSVIVHLLRAVCRYRFQQPILVSLGSEQWEPMLARGAAGKGAPQASRPGSSTPNRWPGGPRPTRTAEPWIRNTMCDSLYFSSQPRSLAISPKTFRSLMTKFLKSFPER